MSQTETQMPKSVIEEITEIYKERGESYGHPYEPFLRLTNAAGMLGVNPSKGDPLHHSLYMILLKISRLLESPRHRDSLMDIVGYVKTYEQTLEKMTDAGG